MLQYDVLIADVQKRQLITWEEETEDITVEVETSNASRSQLLVPNVARLIPFLFNQKVTDQSFVAIALDSNGQHKQ